MPAPRAPSGAAVRRASRRLTAFTFPPAPRSIEAKGGRRAESRRALPHRVRSRSRPARGSEPCGARAEARRHASPQLDPRCRLRRSGARLLPLVVDARVRHLRRALQLPGQAGASGHDRAPGVGHSLSQGLEGREDANDPAKAHQPLPHGRTHHGGQLRGRSQPGRQPQAAVAGNTSLTEIDDPLGSGPYYVASRVPNRQVVLERNRFYRGSRQANVDRVVLTPGLGQGACRQAVEQDELDWCEFLSDSHYREIAARYGINLPNGRFFFNPMLATGYFAFNHDRPAFKGAGQIPLKKAINWAIDRPALVRASGYLDGKRTDQILPPAMGRGASIYPLGGVTEQSLARARAQLARAKFKPKKLVLYSATSPSTFSTWAQIFQFNMKRLGIDVEIKYFGPVGAMFQQAGTRGAPFDVVTGRWSVDYADPSTYFDPLLDGNNLKPTGNFNIAYFDRPKYNRAIERIDRLTGAARRRAWAALDVEMMRDDPPWAPFLNGARPDFVSRSFGCYVFQPVLGRLDIAAACKK